jgi:hypothetical protein
MPLSKRNARSNTILLLTVDTFLPEPSVVPPDHLNWVIDELILIIGAYILRRRRPPFYNDLPTSPLSALFPLHTLAYLLSSRTPILLQRSLLIPIETPPTTSTKHPPPLLQMPIPPTNTVRPQWHLSPFLTGIATPAVPSSPHPYLPPQVSYKPSPLPANVSLCLSSSPISLEAPVVQDLTSIWAWLVGKGE